MARRRTRRRNKTKILAFKLLAFVIIVALLAASVLYFEQQINAYFGWNVQAEYHADGQLRIHYIDVGQGDCAVLELPQGEGNDPMLMLVDGATNKDKQKAIDYIDATFPQLLDTAYFEYVILTHPDEDHCGGLDDIILRYGAKTIYRPNVIAERENNDFVDPALTLSGAQKLTGSEVKDTVAYINFLQAAYSQTIEGTQVIVSINPAYAQDPLQQFINVFDGNNDGDYDDVEDCKITFFGPVRNDYKDINDFSTIFTVDFYGKRALFTGDSEKAGEADFVATYPNFDKADIIKLGHHGSATSSSEEFLNLVARSGKSQVIGIISCGIDNDYGHPTPQVLERWQSLGFSQDKLLRTDTMGTIVLTVKDTITTNTGVVATPATDQYLNWRNVAILIAILAFIALFGTDILKIARIRFY